jgi:two-component system cell cycle sensor histidine kinase/response regulator CckA
VGASTIARDVTDQKRAEGQLRQSQKMEAVGRLAGGVAHDFNNILGIIMSCAELLRAHLGDNPLPVELIGHIRDASQRGASVTRQLLAFSRKKPVEPRVLDLNQRLQDVCKLLAPLLGDDTDVVLLPRSKSALVEADPGQLDQIVINLAVNSRDAMPRGGKFVIETSTVDFDEAFARQHPPMTPGLYVMLAVSDSGCGMDQATVSRIFEPFFTTKEVGKGTGLGLSTVYGIVQQNRGHIWVYSEQGHGTTFKVYLPCADEMVGVDRDVEEETAFERGDGTTILLVEDNTVMRRVTRQMLEEHGYSVIEAEDGRAALKRVALHRDVLDLVLTDVVMPGVSGPEMVLRLMDSHPETKFLYMSGYTSELVVEHGLSEGIALLEKPFTRAALLRTIQTALREG